jgi:hypothetical protein
VPRAPAVLVPKEEIGGHLLLADEARFATADDDTTRDRADSGDMSIDASITRVRAPVRIALRPNAKRALLSVHVIAGVGLLGSVAAVLALNLRAATTADLDLAAAIYELLTMFTVLFGIPLSLLALLSGVLLGFASPWGVVRYAWVIAKLALLLGVIVIGALVLGPGTDAMRAGEGGAEARLIAGSVYDVVALATATGLSIFTPRRRRRR